MLKTYYTIKDLEILDNDFLNYIKNESPDLYNNIILSRSGAYFPDSKLLIDIAFYLDAYLCKRLNIDTLEFKEQAQKMAKMAKFKKNFVIREVAKNIESIDLSDIYEAISYVESKGCEIYEIDEPDINLLRIYVAYKLRNCKEFDALYNIPKKLDFTNLVHSESKPRLRSGFGLTYEFKGSEYSFDQAHYCIFCHNQGKDSCSKGLKDKQNNEFKHNDLGIKLEGCPLEEKISEMNYLKSEGFVFAPLAIAMVDNPMLIMTGHRICNDCMKSCIYQKQEPVNIPHIESQVLSDVLNLPFGVEIYNLLTYWNPLNILRPIVKCNTDKNILVVGSGPAGINAAYHLLMEGNNVVMIEGLRIRPLEPYFISNLIKNVGEVFEDLDKRMPQGFGGVAEYGITNRWNKNFLTLARIILQRRNNFRLYGGIRFGSNITYNQAVEMGFNHILLANGAGKPNLPEIENMLVKGVRTASDFLMNLQSGGAFLPDSLSNLQIRLPAVVIGGGLTAIDTATEVLAYYSRMLDNMFKKLEHIDIPEFRAKLSPEEQEIFNEYFKHFNVIKDLNGDDAITYLKSIGGVKILYRKTLADSPAYRLNHEEIELALKQGIEFIENIVPIKFETDKYGSLKGILTDKGFFEAKSAFIAAGTNPNNIAADDMEGIDLDGKYIALMDEMGIKAIPEKSAKPLKDLFIAHMGEVSVSILGDMHPSFAGNVVKAMASAKRAYPVIQRLIDKAEVANTNIFEVCDNNLITKVHKINRLAPNIIEVIVKSKLAALNFLPGQFYKFQDYSGMMEPIALTGANSDPDSYELSMILLEMGASSKLCANLKPGEEVCLMGPTGMPTEIYKNQVVILAGGGLGNAVLFSIGAALRQNGCFVIYFAGYREKSGIFKREHIENAADIVVWCADDGLPEKFRDTDFSFHGNILDAIRNHTHIENFYKAQHVITIGSDKMMAAVTYCMQNVLKDAKITASINSPMQCMMKEVCAQCISEHIDPVSGEKSYVYSCRFQDQDASLVNFNFLTNRLAQNSILEKIANLVVENVTI